MSDNDSRNTGYWVHQIWHSLQSVVSTLGNSLNVTLSGTGDMNIAQIGGAPTENAPPGMRLGTSIAGVADILVLGVQRLNGTTETFYGSMSWREES